jgi:putative membrane protein
MLRKNIVKGMLGLSTAAALFAVATVQAQTHPADTTRPGATGTPSTSAAPQAGATASGGNAASLSKSDQKILMNMAQVNMAEIEAGRLAEGKSQNDEVKKFAQKMIDDHTKALDEVKQLAQTKGVTLPTDLDRMHKAMATRLSSLSGDKFDRAYLEQAGVSDHKKAHAMLKQAQARAKDPDVKALAARTEPVVAQHLATVQQLHKNTARGGSKTQGTTGSSTDKSGKSDKSEATSMPEKK